MPRALVFVCLAAMAFMAAPAGHAQPGADGTPTQIVEVDLGQRQQGEIQSLVLQAFNRNCDNPQDFVFDVSGTTWLRIAGSPVVPQIGPGRSGTIEAIIDLGGIVPGHHAGTILVDCATCNWFASCQVDRQQIQLHVEVLPSPPVAAGPQGPSAPQGPQGDQGPAGQTFGPAIPADPGTTTPGAERHLRAGQSQALAAARQAAAAAAAAHAVAVERADAARKARNDCEEELARLRAAHAAAAAEAEAAAAGLAAAQAALAAYQSDLDAASAAMERAQRQLEMVAAYRSIVFNETGPGSGRYAEAQAQVDRANDAAVEAQREYSRVRASQEARLAAAAAAEAAAAAAQAAAEAALAALQAKELECIGLAEADAEAQAALGGAAAGAQAANAAAAAAGAGARAQAVANLRAGLEAKRAQLRRCHDALRHRARILTRAFRALRDLGVINPNEVSEADLDFESHVVTSIGQVVAEGAAQAVGLATFEVFTVLDSLQAAYGLIQIRQANLTPTAAGYRGDDYLSDWLEDHGHADNDAESREVINEMERFMTHNGNTDYLRQEWQRLSEDCTRLQREIAADEAELARLGG